MKKSEETIVIIGITLLIIVCVAVWVDVWVAIAKKVHSEPIKEYSPKYELVNVKTEIITVSENAANVVLVQDIRYTLTYIEDGKPVIFQTYDLNLSLCNNPYIQGIDNWYGGYRGCATKEMMASIANKENR